MTAVIKKTTIRAFGTNHWRVYRDRVYLGYIVKSLHAKTWQYLPYDKRGFQFATHQFTLKNAQSAFNRVK